MAGNTLGPRGTYRYVADDGSVYGYLTDMDTAAAVGAVPMTGTALPDLPRRFQPRGIHCEAVDANDRKIRKFVIVPNIAQTNYSSDISTGITIEGLGYIVTGRRGERMTFPKLQALIP